MSLPSIESKTDTDVSRAQGLLVADLLFSGFNVVGLGIVVAGAAYPVVVAGITSPHAAFSSSAGSAETVFIMAVAMIIGAPMGLMWAGGVTLVTFPLVYLVLRTLNVRGNIVVWSSFYGGLVGFISVVMFMLGFDSVSVSHADGESIVALLIGPGLATIMGQLGGAWGGNWTMQEFGWYERAVLTASAGRPSTIRDSQFEAHSQPSHRRLRFGIRQLLWLSVWISVALMAIRLSGVPFEFAILFTFGWVVYQSVTMGIGALVVIAFRKYRNRRQIRST